MTLSHMSNCYTGPVSVSLPTTSYAVLGLLSAGESLSGYELRKRSVFYWRPAQSQIYSELRRLEKLGFVKSKKVPQTGKPDKRMYDITKAGIQEIKRWLHEDPVEPAVVRHPLALRLYFGSLSTPKRLEEMLEGFISQTKATLAELAIVQEFSENTLGHNYEAIVADWHYKHHQAELEAAQAALKRVLEQASSDT